MMNANRVTCNIAMVILYAHARNIRKRCSAAFLNFIMADVFLNVAAVPEGCEVPYKSLFSDRGIVVPGTTTQSGILRSNVRYDRPCGSNRFLH